MNVPEAWPKNDLSLFDFGGDRFTIRYDTIDDLHWKTDTQAASLI